MASTDWGGGGATPGEGLGFLTSHPPMGFGGSWALLVDFGGGLLMGFGGLSTPPPHTWNLGVPGSPPPMDFGGGGVSGWGLGVAGAPSGKSGGAAHRGPPGWIWRGSRVRGPPRMGLGGLGGAPGGVWGRRPPLSRRRGWRSSAAAPAGSRGGPARGRGWGIWGGGGSKGGPGGPGRAPSPSQTPPPTYLGGGAPPGLGARAGLGARGGAWGRGWRVVGGA